MTVKRSRSATRVLSVLEGIAHHQPIGVSELARSLNDDKSAVQRAIMTLADTGWIRTTTDRPRRWQLTAHILTVAHNAHSSSDLLARARPTLEALRTETNETVLLTVPDVRSFVVLAVLESPHLLRTVPHTGMIIPARGSATSRAILPYMSSREREDFLGEPDDHGLLQHFANTLDNGYAVSDGDVMEGSTNIAAPIFEPGGKPVAAIVISAPSERLPEKDHAGAGRLVAQAARSLSRGAPQGKRHGHLEERMADA